MKHKNSTLRPAWHKEFVCRLVETNILWTDVTDSKSSVGDYLQSSSEVVSPNLR